MKMSLKLVELQVALPRMHEAGKIQEQLQQHPELMQAQLVATMQKREERMRRQVTGKRTSENVHLKKEKQESPQRHEHPYKGKNIDLMG
jgi:hypothetical protein